MIALEQLINMGIHELRNYAREVGVAHPCMLLRNDLIANIIRIQNGEQKPCLKSGRGRPPKIKDFDFSVYAKEVTSNDIKDDILTYEMQALRFCNICLEFIKDLKKISVTIEEFINKYDYEILNKLVNENNC